MIFAELPLVSRAGGHVEIDLLVDRLPARAARAFAVAAAAISAVAPLYFAWRLAIVAVDLVEPGGRSSALAISFAPFAAFGALACVLAAALGILREIGR